MAALVWDREGEHFFETGVSHGVLYTQTKTANQGGGYTIDWADGVAWNGLTSVSESPDGGDEQTFYADNIKYLSLRGTENFGGSIGAYQSPVEFDKCDGTATLGTVVSDVATSFDGITVGQQTRVPFCFVYITQKGNDQEGSEYGEIINIVYNATASPSSRDYNTINDSPEPNELSWDFTTTPVAISATDPVTGKKFKPTSHLKIDTTRFVGSAAQAKLDNIKKALFGSDNTYTYVSKTPTANPQAEGLYEKNGSNEFVLTTDTTIVSEKTYYERLDAGQPHILMPDQIISMMS